MGPKRVPTSTRRCPAWLQRRHRFVDVRPGERHDVISAVATLFVFMCAHGVLETARDALFLARLPAERLPWVYVAMAGAGTVLAWLSARRRAPRAGGRRLSTILGVSAVVTASLALPAAETGTLLPYVVYVWTGLVATFGTVELWQLLGDRFTADQAKRLYGLIGAGAIAGVVVGSAFAAVLSERYPPGALLLVAAAVSVVAALLARRLAPGAEPEAVRPRPSAMRVLRTEPHARKVLYLVLLASLTLTVANFLFKSYVAGAVAPARLGVFFGWFYALVNAASLIVQIAFTAVVMRWLGTVRSLAVLPSVLVAGGTIFLGTPVVSVLVAMKAFDGVARHSILKTAMELLFLPLPRDARHALKAVLEALGQRGGQAIASAGILLASWMQAGPRVLVMAVIALSVLWLLALVDVPRHYVALFRRRLRAAAFDRTKPLPELEREDVEALIESLAQPDRPSGVATALLAQAGWVARLPDKEQEAARGAARTKMPTLLAMLERRGSREEARAGLRDRGAAAEAALRHALVSPNTPLALRRHVPRTLATFPSAESAALLLERLGREPDGVTRFKILAALVALSVARPDLEIDPPTIATLATSTLRRATELLVERVALRSSAAGCATCSVLVDLLRQKEEHALGRVFMLLTLVHPGELDWIYEGSRSADPRLRAASHAVIAEVVEPPLREELLLLLDDVDDEEKASLLAGVGGAPIATRCLRASRRIAASPCGS